MSNNTPLKGRRKIEKAFKNIRQKSVPTFRLPKIGFRPVMPEHEVGASYGKDARTLMPLLISAVLLVGARFVKDEGIVRPLILISALAFAGKDVFITAFEKAVAGKYYCEETVFIFTALVSFLFGLFSESAVIMLAYRCVRLCETVFGKKTDSVTDWLKIELPKRCKVETKDGLKTVSPAKIKKGRQVIVPANGIIPADGTVLEGESSISSFPVTGIEKSESISYGSRVFSGCINGVGEIRIKAERDCEQSTASVINSMLTHGVTYSSEKEKRIDYWTHLFSTGCLWAGIILAIVPPCIIGSGTSMWVGKGCGVIALSMCYPLSRAVSMSYLAGMVQCAAKGINVGGCRILEKLSSLSAIIFNKTGTLTENTFDVEEVFAKTMDDYELLAVAAVAEQFSEHPIAKAICRECPSFEHMERAQVQFEEIAGRGVSVGIRGRHIFVGNAGLLEENGIKCDIPRRGSIAIHIAVDRKYCGHIVMSNKLKESAFDVVESLRSFRINSFVLLTGDLLTAARAAASTLNLDMLKAELTKGEKLSAIEYLKTAELNGKSVAYVCCGCEDEEYFTKADVGISIGALGCDGAMRSADVLIMSDDMKLLPKALEYAGRAGKTADIETIAYGAFKLILIILTIAGFCPVGTALIADVVGAAVTGAYSSLSIKISD